MCGVPVIIEGETGVGKTALLHMVSILWNRSLQNFKKSLLRDLAQLLTDRLPENGEWVTIPTGAVLAMLLHSINSALPFVTFLLYSCDPLSSSFPDYCSLA